MAAANIEITIRCTNIAEAMAWAADHNDRPEGWRDPNPAPSAITVPFNPCAGSAGVAWNWSRGMLVAR
jgi:hypothetical protein